MEKCIIVVNTYKKDAQLLASQITEVLGKRNVKAEILLFSDAKEEFCFEGFSFAITLGGDGTVLYAARKCAPLKMPIFPINLGEFGFIAGINKSSWIKPLDLFLERKLPWGMRSLVEVSIIRNQQTIFSSTALNDVVIRTSGPAQIAELDINCSDNPFGKFKADGIIVATSTGSTAYSAAVGGPIINPEIDVMVLSPISPFSLSNRPLVLPSNSVISIKVLPSRGAELVLSCDGQVSENLENNDIIIVRRAKDKVLLVGCDAEIFYTALRSKLNWSGGPNA